jgi:beta-N-acetylhexosaminidase
MTRAFVTGLAGTEFTEAELAFLRAADPFGLILFRRNVADREQLKRVTGAFRDAVGRDAPVMVDQEGGRVQRLTAPHWRKYPSAARLAAAAAFTGSTTLVRDVARLMAADLREVGINVDCTPCLDLAVPGATVAIGDRAFSGDPHVVAACGRAVAEGMLAGGVLPVIKHIPGHGRAMVDSHHALPVVTARVDELEALDFAPFVALADLPAGMTAHLVYTEVDPDNPATQSETVIAEIIRGLIGFDGLLFSDDMSMNALSGGLGERATRALAAGCDIALHCNGIMAEMEEVAAAAPELGGRALERAGAALSRIGAPDTVDLDELAARMDEALAAFDAAAGI